LTSWLPEARTEFIALLQTSREIQATPKNAVRATFIKAREHLHAFRTDFRFSAWLCRIGAIEALLKLRGRYPREAAFDQCTETESKLMRNELPYCADNPDEHYTQAELRQLATGTTNILNPICRIIFFLCDVEKWSVGETADFLGLPVSVVTASLPRTRQEIAEHLNRQSRELNHLLPRCSAPPGGSSKEIDRGDTCCSVVRRACEVSS
jgi:DNA-directed RNA polymerase specialized sigma24 family protein